MEVRAGHGVGPTAASVSYLKGAPEVLIARSALPEAERESWNGKAEAYAREGFRVLALAWGDGDSEEELSFLGLVLLWDPPRAEVPDAVATAQAAGIRVVMITGDHPATALAVARMIGVPGVRVLTGEDLDRYGGPELTAGARARSTCSRACVPSRSFGSWKRSRRAATSWP